MGVAAVIQTLGLVLGLLSLLYFPAQLDSASGLIAPLTIRGFGFVVTIGFLYGVFLSFFKTTTPRRGVLEFGWSFGAMNYGWLFALSLASLAIFLYNWKESMWPVALFTALCSLNSLISCVFLRTCKDFHWISLPYIDLYRGNPHPRIIDLGCGGGRTTVTLSTAWPKDSTVTCLDLFSAEYIKHGGMALLEHNIVVAGIDKKQVSIMKGDMTDMSSLFPEGSFDCAVSVTAMDHLPTKQKQLLALKEIRRILVPGGRLLLVVLVPGIATFMLASIGCLGLTSKSSWRHMADEAGLSRVEEGYINGTWFLLCEKQK